MQGTGLTVIIKVGNVMSVFFFVVVVLDIFDGRLINHGSVGSTTSVGAMMPSRRRRSGGPVHRHRLTWVVVMIRVGKLSIGISMVVLSRGGHSLILVHDGVWLGCRLQEMVLVVLLEYLSGLVTRTIYQFLYSSCRNRKDASECDRNRCCEYVYTTEVGGGPWSCFANQQ